MRHIACIATANIERPLHSWVASLRHVGWTYPIYVFNPENDVPDVPDNCISVTLRPWWLAMHGGEDMLKEVNNTAALLKPKLFLSSLWQDGDQVLYVDCADTVFFRNPNELFDLCEGVPVSARSYAISSRDVVMPEHIYKNLGIPMRIFNRDKTVNSGVICCTVGERMRDAINLWQALCSYIPSTGSWLQNKKKVGDQKAFNVAFRVAKDKDVSNISYLPKCWNDRDGIRNMYLDGGKLYSKTTKEEVCLPHSAGNKALPDTIRRAAVGEVLSERVYFGFHAEPPDITEKGDSSKYSPSELRSMRRNAERRAAENVFKDEVQ